MGIDCDPLVYSPPEDPTPPASRTLAGKPADEVFGDILICNDQGSGISGSKKNLGSGNGSQSPMLISEDSVSVRGGYREIGGGIVSGTNITMADDLGSFPKSQYINNSEIVLDLDSASIFYFKITRMDRLYTVMLKSNYHTKSSDGERICVGYVKKTSFGDVYVFVDGTSDDQLTSLPAGRNLSIDSVPNLGTFIFETLPVQGKPATDSSRTIYMMIEYAGETSGSISISFDEFFDFESIGGGNAVVNTFVFPKPLGFTVVKDNNVFDFLPEEVHLYELKILNPTMYLINEDDFFVECIPNYNSVTHNNYSKKMLLSKIF
jgi:hypothetical protein